MARKKYNPDEINEDLIISTIQHEQPASEKPKEQAKPQPTVKKNRTAKDYDSLFIRQSGSKARLGKHVPIRQEYHEKIQQIVRVICKDEISIFNYIDNVLTQHFEEHHADIVKRYKENIKDIFI
jgi:hypothetical protein